MFGKEKPAGPARSTRSRVSPSIASARVAEAGFEGSCRGCTWWPRWCPAGSGWAVRSCPRSLPSIRSSSCRWWWCWFSRASSWSRSIPPGSSPAARLGHGGGRGCGRGELGRFGSGGGREEEVVGRAFGRGVRARPSHASGARRRRGQRCGGGRRRYWSPSAEVCQHERRRVRGRLVLRKRRRTGHRRTGRKEHGEQRQSAQRPPVRALAERSRAHTPRTVDTTAGHPAAGSRSARIRA